MVTHSKQWHTHTRQLRISSNRVEGFRLYPCWQSDEERRDFRPKILVLILYFLALVGLLPIFLYFCPFLPSLFTLVPFLILHFSPTYSLSLSPLSISLVMNSPSLRKNHYFDSEDWVVGWFSSHIYALCIRLYWYTHSYAHKSTTYSDIFFVMAAIYKQSDR